MPLSDFTGLDVTGDGVYLGPAVTGQWALISGAVQSLGAYFSAKVAGSGTAPSDVLAGMIFGAAANFNKWKLVTSTNDLVLQYNTGTEGAPVWTTRVTFDSSVGITLATSSITSGTFADARIAESNVTQHVAAIDHDSLLNFLAAEHLDWTADQGASNIHTGNISAVLEAVVTAHEAAIDHDALTNFVAAEHIDWTSDQGATNIHVGNVPNAGDADTVDGVEAAAMGQLAVTAEWTKAQGSTESTPSSSAGSITIDFEASNYFEITLTENITSITINNTSKPGTRVIKIIQDSTTRTVAGWPAAVKWPNGAAPTITASSGAVDILSFVVDSGGNIYGAFQQDFS
jgi:hypothetical protein